MGVDLAHLLTHYYWRVVRIGISSVVSVWCAVIVIVSVIAPVPLTDIVQLQELVLILIIIILLILIMTLFWFWLLLFSTFTIVFITFLLIIFPLHFHRRLECLHLVFDYDILLQLLLDDCTRVSKVHLLCRANDRNVLLNYLLLLSIILLLLLAVLLF